MVLIVVGIHVFFLNKGGWRKICRMFLCLTRSAHHHVICIFYLKQGKINLIPRSSLEWFTFCSWINHVGVPPPPKKKNPASWLQINDGAARWDLTCMNFVVLFGLLFTRLVWRRPPVAGLPSGSHPVASEGAWMTSWEDRSNFAYNSVTKQARVAFCSIKEVWRIVAELNRGGPSAEARL